MFNLLNAKKFALLLSIALILSASIFAQTTQFTYQGRFNDASVPSPTNGTYQMEFKAFDAVSGGNQFASTVTLPTVQVVNGIFTVTLDFGAQTFQGANVFLEISVRPSGNPNPYTILNPRQKVTSAPYSIQSLKSITALNADNAANLGGIAANQYVQTTDARMSDARTPTAGSFSYIQNTNSTQPFASFNVSGNGTVGAILSGNIVNSSTQYNINNSRVLSIGGTNNIFAGIGAGTANTGGSANSFFGNFAGASNTNGDANAFFGRSSGANNQSGSGNSFFGVSAGGSNISGMSNSFFGKNAGISTTAGNNSFFGAGAGFGNTVGSNNTLIGFSANVGGVNPSNATAIGANALVTQSNSLVLGSINGVNGATANTMVGIGTTSPNFPLTIKSPTSNYGLVIENGNVAVGAGVTNTVGFYRYTDESSVGFSSQRRHENDP